MEDKKLYQALKNNVYSLPELVELLKKEPVEVKKGLKRLEAQGFDIQSRKGRFYLRDTQNYSERHVHSLGGKDEEKSTIVMTSDWHVASKQHDGEGLEGCMGRAMKDNPELLLHSGDICDGFKVYHGHMNNLDDWTVEGQTDRAAAAFRDVKIPCYGIGGNHDYSFTMQNGVRALQLIEQKAPNFTDLGDFQADFIFKGLDFRLMHGAGGNAYSVSYPAQRYLRNLAEGNPDDVPDFLQIGHFHTSIVFDAYGCTVVHPSNFQKPNDFATRRGLRGVRGLYVIKLTTKGGKLLDSDFKFIRADTR